MVSAIHLKDYYPPETYRAHLQLPPSDEVQEDTQSTEGNDAPDPPNSATPDRPQNTPNPTPAHHPLPNIPDSTPNLPQDHPTPPATGNQSTSSQPQDKMWNIKEIPTAKFKNNRRLIRVVWEDGTRTWEPDEMFSPEMLADINIRFTKSGKRKRTCFVKPSQS